MDGLKTYRALRHEIESLVAGFKAMGFQLARAAWGILILLGIGQVLPAYEDDKSAILAIRVTDTADAAVEDAEVRFVQQTSEKYEVKRTDKMGRVLHVEPRNSEILEHFQLKIISDGML